MRIFIGGVAVVLAIVASGCGGGGGSDTAESAVTKAQFIKRGDEICRTAQESKEQGIVAWQEKSEKEGKGLGDFSAKELGHVYLTVALPPVKKAADELAELTPPAGDAEAEELVESMASTVKAIEEEPTQGIEEGPYEAPDKLAQAYGFKVCGLF